MWNHYRIRPAYASPEVARASCRRHQFPCSLPFHSLKATHSIPYPKKTLGDLTTFVASGITPRGGNSTYVESGPQLIRSQNVLMGSLSLENVARINPEIFDSMRRVRVLFDDVLLNITGASIGRVCRVGLDLGDAVVNQHVAIIRTRKETLSPTFLAYALRTERLQQTILSGQTGAAQGGFNHQKIRALEIPFPPLPEQDRIVEILDQADALRQQRRQADALSQRILPALFHEMFGDVVGNSKSWPVSTIGNCVDSRLGKMLDRGKDEEADPQPYLANLNVRWGAFDLEGLRTMDFSEADRKEFELLPGDVLICEGGEVGRSAIWRKPDSGIYFQKALHRVRVNSAKLTPEYFQFYMHSMAIFGGLAKHVGNAVIGHLTGVKLKQLEIPLPPLDLQRNFSANYLAIEQLTGQTTTSAATLETLFQTLLHRAFDGSLTAKWREGHAKEMLQEMERKVRQRS
jgi:type I restriction enzyme, S subunit